MWGRPRAGYRQIAAYRPASIAGARRAMIDWPEKKADLSQGIQQMADVKARSEALWKERSRAIGAPDADALLILETHQNLEADGLQLARLDSRLGQKVDQLYLSWDRILVDMDIREGETLTLHHKYKTVTVQIQDPQKKQGAHSESEAWVQVSKATFDALEDKLGMSVARKPAGKYEEEAESLAQPAGYSYLAPPGQSNQYGQWRRTATAAPSGPFTASTCSCAPSSGDPPTSPSCLNTTPTIAAPTPRAGPSTAAPPPDGLATAPTAGRRLPPTGPPAT